MIFSVRPHTGILTSESERKSLYARRQTTEQNYNFKNASAYLVIFRNLLVGMASSCFVSDSPKGAVPFIHALFSKQVNFRALYLWRREVRQCKTFQCICSQAFVVVDLQMYSILKILKKESWEPTKMLKGYHIIIKAVVDFNQHHTIVSSSAR